MGPSGLRIGVLVRVIAQREKSEKSFRIDDVARDDVARGNMARGDVACSDLSYDDMSQDGEEKI